MPSAIRRLGVLVLGLMLVGCAAMRPGAPALLSDSVQALLPHADGDHFVYVWERIVDGQRIAQGIQVEHVTVVTAAEFEISMSEDGRPAGRVRLRDDGHAVWLLSEDDLTRGLGLSYDPPLLQFQAPVVAGEYRAAATATMTTLANSQVAGTVGVTQTITLSSAPAARAAVGTFPKTVAVRAVRTLQLLQGDTELHSESILAPGIGEIRSEGSASGTPALRRELACAIIGGARLGDCSKLNERWKD